MTRRRLIFPVVVVILQAVGFFLPSIWLWADLDPGPFMSISMFGIMGAMLGFPLLLIWFLFFSGLAWKTKLFTLCVLIGAVGAFAACVRKVEFPGMVFPPIFVMRWDPQLVESAAVAPAATTIDLAEDPQRDFPRYRGRLGDGVVLGLTLATDWDAHAPRELWRRKCVGGYAGFAVVGNVAVTLEQRDDNEAIVCYDRATGSERWVVAYPAHFKQTENMGGDGPRSTPTVAGGHVYAVGATGRLTCVNAAEGKEVWSVDILADNGATNLVWAMAGSPLVVGDRVVVNPGIDPKNNSKKSLAAYDRLTGKKLWAAGEHQAGYSSPQSARLAGIEQALIFDAGGLSGHDLNDGRVLWHFPFASEMDMAIAQPLVVGDDRVFITSQPSNGCGRIRVTKTGNEWKAEPVWTNRKMYAQFSNPILADGFVYGLSAGFLVCLKLETGERTWRDGRFGAGQLLRVGDVLVVCGEGGQLAVVAADPKAYRELARLKVSESKKNWNTPTIAGNQLFLRNHLQMVCYELPGK